MNPWRGLRDLPREIWILFATTLVNRCGTMVLPFLVLYLTRELGISVSHAALALTVYGIAALLIMPIVGRLSDRLGSLFVMRCSLLLSGFVLFLFPLAHHFGAILAITFVFAILNESVRPPSLALVSDLVKPSQRKQAFALSRLAVNLGMSVGPAIGGILAVYSFRFLFLVDGATSVLAGLVLIFGWPGPRRTKTSEPQWDDAEELGREIEAEGPGLLAAPHPAVHLRAFRNWRMLYFLAALIPTQLVFFQLTSTVPVFLVRYLRLPESFFGTVFTLNTLMIVALEVPLNNATYHWTHRRTLTLGALLYAIGFGSFALARGAAGIFAAVAVWTFGEMILMPGSAAYASEIATAGRRGEYMGLYTMSFSFAFSVGPWLGAILLETHGPQMLWGVAFVSGCISTLLMSQVGGKARLAQDHSR